MLLRHLDEGTHDHRHTMVRRCLVEGTTVDALIDEKTGDGEQDRIYKRRARGLAWVRGRLKG